MTSYSPTTYVLVGAGAIIAGKALMDYKKAQDKAATVPKKEDPARDLFSSLINGRTPSFVVGEGPNPFPPEELARKEAMERENLAYLPRPNGAVFPDK